MVIFTPAIPKGHLEYNYLQENGYTILKRSEVLGLDNQGYKTVALPELMGRLLLRRWLLTF